MNDLLVADSVTKKFGEYTALNQVSISVPKGSVFGLLGPNGAGKTTFIRIINQITMPDTGSVLLDGEPLRPLAVAAGAHVEDDVVVVRVHRHLVPVDHCPITILLLVLLETGPRLGRLHG